MNSYCAFSLAASATSFLLLANLIRPALTQETGFFSKETYSEQFIQSIPSDCEYIAESDILGTSSFFIIQPCSRGGGAEIHEIPKAIRVAPGILYIPKQSLSKGEVNEGFWCTNKAERTTISFSMLCTRSGWQKGPLHR